MSSAIRNASTTDVFFSTTWSRRSFSITIRVSTRSRRLSMPSSACWARLRPSKAKGFVTTPTVSAPISRASSARTGAPPVPVPPPSPAVTKTMSAPFSASFSSSRLSCAAALPTTGSAPAPRPRVACEPMWILTSASHISSAWASVLTAMNSTPVNPASTMRLTAFVPPPPTPTTLITARKFPVWSLTLKGARPEALVEPLLFRPIRRRRVRGFYSAVNGEARLLYSTSTLEFRVATCNRTRRDRHVEVPARPLYQRQHARGDRQFQRQGRGIAEPKLGALGEHEGQFAVRGSHSRDPPSEPSASHDRECPDGVGCIGIGKRHANVDARAAGDPDPWQLRCGK